MIEETLNKLVRDIINSVIAAGYSIRAHQDGPRPNGGYATVHVANIVSIGTADIELVDQAIPSVDIDRNISITREAMISINTYRSTAIDNIGKILNCFERESVQALLRAANVGYVRSSQARFLPVEDAAKNEERAQFDLTLYIEGTDTEVVRAIESVEVGVEFQSAGNVFNGTIGVQ